MRRDLMQREAVVYEEPVAVAGRLDALGIDQPTLVDSVKEGVAFVLACTRHDPLYLPGILGSGKIVRALRDRLIPRGWVYSNPRNYALTTDPGGSFAIAVAGGDASTGREQTPTTRTEKGPATRDAIYGNLQHQLAEVDPQFPRVDKSLTVQTWILLYFIDDHQLNEIRMELSLPSGMDRDGYVTSWRERIVLPAEPFGAVPVSVDKPKDGGDQDDVTVAVERRTAS